MVEPLAVDAALRAPAGGLLSRVEEAGLNAAQPPPQQLPIDGWLLCFSAGKARRARSVNAIAAGRLALPEKPALCRHWYQQVRLPLLVRIAPFSQPAALDGLLAGAGFIAFDETRVMSAPLAAPVVQPDRLQAREVDIEAFAEAIGAVRGSPNRHIDAPARRLSTMPLRAQALRRLAGGRDGEPGVAGQGLVGGGRAGLYDIVTAKAARGRGLGRDLGRRLLQAAQARDARTAYLRVDAGNAPARRICAALACVDRYAWWYRRPSGTADEIEGKEEWTT